MTGDHRIPNPLYAAGPLGEPGRQAGLVFLAGIVGVPWQDIATDGEVPVAAGEPQPVNSLSEPRALVYLTAQELESMGRWDVILGRAGSVPPSDPLMIESIDPRMTGAAHPLQPSGAIAAPGTSGNSINGAEQAVDPATRDDLQFACIFTLPAPLDCNATNAAGCDCNASEYVKLSPLCQYIAPNTDGQQIRAKAYPSVRELEVLRGVGDAGIVASICPKNPVKGQGSIDDPAADANYGYNPAVTAIVDRIKDVFKAKCLPRPLDSVSQEDVDFGRADPEEVGKIPCSVVEATPLPASGACSPCGSGRALLEGRGLELIPAVKNSLRDRGRCGGAPLPSCDDYCLCEIRQFTGTELLECLTAGAPSRDLNGYCYVDPAQAGENAAYDGTVSAAEQDLVDRESALVASCKDTERRVLRFLGDNLPARDGLTFLACAQAAGQ